MSVLLPFRYNCLSTSGSSYPPPLARNSRPSFLSSLPFCSHLLLLLCISLHLCCDSVELLGLMSNLGLGERMRGIQAFAPFPLPPCSLAPASFPRISSSASPPLVGSSPGSPARPARRQLEGITADCPTLLCRSFSSSVLLILAASSLLIDRLPLDSPAPP